VPTYVISLENNIIAIGSYSGTINIYKLNMFRNTMTGICLKTLYTNAGYIYYLNTLPDGKIISLNETSIQIWDQYTGYCDKTLFGQTARCDGIVVNSTGQIITLESETNTLFIWK